MYLNYLYWTSIIRDLYNQVNHENNIERRIKKIAKSMAEKNKYGVTGCQKGSDILHFKLYVNILNEGNILDGEFSRLIFVNNPYVTKDINYPNLIFFDIVADEISNYEDDVLEIVKNLKIKNFNMKIDLHFTENEKFKVSQYLPNEDFIFIDNIKERRAEIQKMTNEFKNKLTFVQINNIGNYENFKFFDNVKKLDNILTYREMLYFISFTEFSFFDDLNLYYLSLNFTKKKVIVNSDFSLEKYTYELNELTLNRFLDFEEIISNDLCEVNKNIVKGKQSIIKTFKISDNTKNQIEEKINLKISEIIVKKTYIDVENDPNPNRDNSLIHNMGGKFEQIRREINSLKKLYKKDHFPILLGVDFKNFCIYMNYCGSNLSSKNLPSNWKNQLEKISISLIDSNVYNNDVWINNFLVHENKLHLIDFGYSSFYEPFYPLLNLNKDRVSNITDPINYLTYKIKTEINEEKLNFKTYFLSIYQENYNQYKNSINGFEDLHIFNGNRPTEIHTIISWDGKNDYLKTKECCEKLPPNFKIIYEKQINLNMQEQRNLIDSIYHVKANNRVKNNSIYLVVVEDSNPNYTYEKATKCWQVLNKNMKIIKEDLRVKIGGSSKNFGTIHTSYNVEETLLVLQPLNLIHLVKRPTFKSFNELFDFLNNDKLLKYVVLRSFFELEYSPNDYGPKKDVDVIVNDYYYFKAITGARADLKYRDNMRENDNGYNSLNTINIGGVEIRFDIRYIGDNYFDSEWERDVLNRRINHQLKDNLNIFVPCTHDELYTLMYNIIVQKPNPEKNKHIPRVEELLKKIKVNINFKKEIVTNFLIKFMNKNYYDFKKPFDKSVNFFI